MDIKSTYAEMTVNKHLRNNGDISANYTPVFSKQVRDLMFLISGTYVDPELVDSLSRIIEIENLKTDWNGNGAPAFQREQIETMRDLVHKLQKQPFITPTANETIQFEYEDESGNYLEFELLPDLRVKEFTYSADGVANKEFIDIEKVSEVVDAFHRRAISR